MLWRSGDYAYYAERVGPLSLDQRLDHLTYTAYPAR
jgi:hypothetical protein